MLRDIIETFILMLIALSFITCITYIMDLQDHVQELNSYIKSHNTRLNKLEQPELWRHEHEKEKEKAKTAPSST